MKSTPNKSSITIITRTIKKLNDLVISKIWPRGKYECNTSIEMRPKNKKIKNPNNRLIKIPAKVRE